MLVNGAWAGWGLGDHSIKDFTVQRAKDYMRRAYRSYAGGLADTNIFDQQMQDVVVEMQNRLVKSGQLTAGKFLLGVLDLPTQYAMGFKRLPPLEVKRPVVVTVEGHMSNMWAGPCADTAQQLENEGVCWHQPTGYNNGKIPFDNKSGVEAVAENFRHERLPSGRPFPRGTKCGLFGYSQGGIIITQFWQQYLQPGQELAWRTPDLKVVLAYANPCREKNAQAEWSKPGGYGKDTQGLSPDRMVNTPSFWQEIGKRGDLFADNDDDEDGRIKSAVYEMVMGNFFKGPVSILATLTRTLQQPASMILPIFTSIYQGIKFLAANPNPHYSPFMLDGGLNYARAALR